MNRLFWALGMGLLIAGALAVYWVPGGSDWMLSFFSGMKRDGETIAAHRPAIASFAPAEHGPSTLHGNRQLVDIDSPRMLADKMSNLGPDSRSTALVDNEPMTNRDPNGIRTNEAPVQFASMTQADPQDGRNATRRIPNDGLAVPSVTTFGVTQAPPSRPGIIMVERGTLSFKDDIEVSAQSDGAIMELHVDDGSFIRKGEPLIEIDSRLAQADMEVQNQELEAAKFKASDTSGIEYAKAAVEVALVDVEISKQLLDKDAESDSDYRKKRLELIKAKLQVKVAQIEKERDRTAVGVAQAKLNASKIQLSLRSIPAPFDGTAWEITKHRYAWVRAGEPIMKLSSMETLRATGIAFVTDSPHLLLGLPARVSIVVAPGKMETVDGVVGYVAPKSEDGMRYKVWVDIPNKVVDGHYLFRAGMLVTIEVNTTGLK